MGALTQVVECRNLEIYLFIYLLCLTMFSRSSNQQTAPLIVIHIVLRPCSGLDGHIKHYICPSVRPRQQLEIQADPQYFLRLSVHGFVIAQMVSNGRLSRKPSC